MSNIKVTVLIPAYNAADYIAEAIDSVLNQTFTDFEILIINDGSTDRTEQIIQSYHDERIVLHSQENKGVIGALNKGLELARGEYIARFDADDVCYPERLAIQYEFLQNNPEYILIGGVSDYIDMNGEYLFKWNPPGFTHEEIKKIIYTECPIDHPTAMYKKQIAIDLGGYPNGAIHFEDHIFWTMFFKKGKICNMHETLIKHRFNPGSVTIDEKWRGPVFKKIKYRSILQGYVNQKDIMVLKEVLKAQGLKKYKAAAYYSMIGKKYLWNNYQPKKARQNALKTISLKPFKFQGYGIIFLSYLPERFIVNIYKKYKRSKN